MNTQARDGQVAGHRVRVPGARLYYQRQGNGPKLVLLGGGPANADTLAPLAKRLAARYTVISYDRRGYSRSELDDPGEQAGISRHGADLRLLIEALGPEPAAVFGTSFGALIALELAASAPAQVGTVVVHEPPLGQLLTGEQRRQFDLKLEDKPDAGAALAAIAASVGVKRGLDAGGGGTRPEVRRDDIELFIRRDVPAIGAYRLDVSRLAAVSGRLVVTGSEAGRAWYPYACARRLAEVTGAPFAELPGDHAGMIKQPDEFAAVLFRLLSAA
jgi:pimeloyl-ACP methyl ester carboxylesterase